MRKGAPTGRLRLLLCRYAGAAFVLIGPVLSACAPGPVLTGRDMDSPHVLPKPLVFYPQDDYQCGPAALASVMSYWGIDVTPEEIAREIYSSSARGTLTIDMDFYAQKKGLEASQYAGSLDDIRVRINSGHPIIVLVDAGVSVIRANHFMVITGYTDSGVIVNSGKREGLLIPYDEFLSSWGRTRNWTLLVKPGEAH